MYCNNLNSMASESSSDEVPGTPPQKVRKLIGGLSGNRKLIKEKNNTEIKSTNNISGTSSTPKSPVHACEQHASNITETDSQLNDSEEVDYISETSSELLSPLRPLYSGSPHWPGDAQDLIEMNYWSFMSSSSSDSSLPSATSVALLSSLGSPSSSETEFPTSPQKNFPTSPKSSPSKKQ